MLDIVGVCVVCLFPNFVLTSEGGRQVSNGPGVLERKCLPTRPAVHRPVHHLEGKSLADRQRAVLVQAVPFAPILNCSGRNEPETPSRSAIMRQLNSFSSVMVIRGLLPFLK